MIKKYLMKLQRNYLLNHESAEGQTFTMPSMVDTEVHNPSIQEIMEKYSVGILPVNTRQPYFDGDLNSEDLTPPTVLDDFSDLLAQEDASNNIKIDDGDNKEKEGEEGEPTDEPDADPSA